MENKELIRFLIEMGIRKDNDINFFIEMCVKKNLEIEELKKKLAKYEKIDEVI